jgi:long-chain fatty acid transport protein
MKTSQNLSKFFAVGLATSWSYLALADQFHYQNLVIGDRAIGLGGAFGGVADDASGTYYNPAGTGFALTNDVSGTANAFVTRKVVYKKALGTMDFTEESGANPPVFFGILQKLDNISKGLVASFSMITLDAELKDQDDTVKDQPITSRYKGGVTQDAQIHQYHRTANARGATSSMTLALAKRVTNGICVGFGLTRVTVEELVQEYQDTRTQAYVVGEDGTKALSSSVGHQAQNIRQNLTASGLQGVLGIQAAIGGKFSLGLTAKAGKWTSSNLAFQFEQMQLSIPQDGSKAIADAIAAGSAATVTAQMSAKQQKRIDEKEGALGAMPAEGRFGFAWFASTRALLTADTTWVDNVDDADPRFMKEKVVNYSAGFEYYLQPSIPVRLGAFTNNDARPVVDPKEAGQQDHIDYLGETLFFAWVQPNNQLAAGVVLQQGTGKAQKLGDMSVQDVSATASTFAFSISSSL